MQKGCRQHASRQHHCQSDTRRNRFRTSGFAGACDDPESTNGASQAAAQHPPFYAIRGIVAIDRQASFNHWLFGRHVNAMTRSQS